MNRSTGGQTVGVITGDNEIEEGIKADEIESIRIAIRSRHSQIRELNKRLVELGSEPEEG